MSYLLNKQSEELSVIPKGYSIAETIPPGNWLLNYNPKTGYYLKKSENFTYPKKVYGNLDSKAERILSVFNKGNKNLGVLLRGLKGTGKTLLSKKICINSGMPVILVSQGYNGSEFISFVNSIKVPCIFFFDEFEKTYFYDQDSSKDLQETLLSLLDGSLEGVKKLYILTANEGTINSAFLNRPGRIRYETYYEGLPPEVIDEVIEDLLVDKSKKEDIDYIIKILGVINIDSLMSIIEEVNNFPEDSVLELANSMNIFPESGVYMLTWSDSNVVSLNKSSSKDKGSFCVIDEHPLNSEYIYLDNKTIKGNNRIDLKKCKILEAGEVIRIEFEGVIITCKPLKQARFKFEKNPNLL